MSSLSQSVGSVLALVQSTDYRCPFRRIPPDVEAIRQCADVALETLDFGVRSFSFYFLCLTVWLLMVIPSDFLPVKYQVQTRDPA